MPKISVQTPQACEKRLKLAQKDLNIATPPRRRLAGEAEAEAAADAGVARAGLLEADPRSPGRMTAEGVAVQRGSPGDSRSSCRVRITNLVGVQMTSYIEDSKG